MATQRVVAIDLGGTKATVAVMDGDGRVLARSVRPTPRIDPVAAIGTFAARARRMLREQQASGVGMALPAIVDTEGTIRWAAASIPGWTGVHARAALEDAFGVPTSVEFDGYAATLGEATFGAGRGHRSMVTLIVGTGFGAGVWLDGRVVRGAPGVAGAVGWSRWPDVASLLSDPAESIGSGAGIVANARRRSPGGSYLDARAVFRAARTGDQAARGAIEDASLVCGVVAGAAVNLVAPELVVWTGGVGSRRDFSARATRIAERCCQPFAVGRTQFERSRLGAESSLMGAAAQALAVSGGRSHT